MAIRRNTLKVKGRTKTKSQLKQQSRIKSNRSASIKGIVDHTSKGVGKYAKRSSADLSRRQAYRLESKALTNERHGLNTKPEMIRALGQALAMNSSPATTYSATAGAAKIVEAQNKDSSSINNLINGGVNQAGKDNDEEYQDSLPGGAMIR